MCINLCSGRDIDGRTKDLVPVLLVLPITVVGRTDLDHGLIFVSRRCFRHFEKDNSIMTLQNSGSCKIKMEVHSEARKSQRKVDKFWVEIQQL